MLGRRCSRFAAVQLPEELVVLERVHSFGVLAGQRVDRVVTGEGGLVEDGLVAAQEAVLVD